MVEWLSPKPVPYYRRGSIVDAQDGHYLERAPANPRWEAERDCEAKGTVKLTWSRFLHNEDTMNRKNTIPAKPHPKGLLRRHSGRFLLTLLAIGLAGSAHAATRIAIVQGRWHFNGQVTYPGTPAEGLLMNVRMVNAVFEDRNKPDFNADANTDQFIARIPEYAACGVRAFTLCLQGGMPGYEGAVNSAFDPDGGLRPAYLARADRVIRACDRHGLAVILGLYYQRQSKVLRDEAAVRARAW